MADLKSIISRMTLLPARCTYSLKLSLNKTYFPLNSLPFACTDAQVQKLIRLCTI